MRLKKKERHNKKYDIREELAISSIMLLHNIKRKKDISQKLGFKWLGPYKIYNAVKKKVIYIFEELNRSYLAGTFTGDPLKKFHPCQQLDFNYIPNFD